MYSYVRGLEFRIVAWQLKTRDSHLRIWKPISLINISDIPSYLPESYQRSYLAQTKLESDWESRRRLEISLCWWGTENMHYRSLVDESNSTTDSRSGFWMLLDFETKTNYGKRYIRTSCHGNFPSTIERVEYWVCGSFTYAFYQWK